MTEPTPMTPAIDHELLRDERARAAAFDRIFEPLNRSDAPGVVVAAAVDGRTVYRRGFGLASVEQGRANTPATRMRIGSTSKQFTALALLLLVERGLVDLDCSARSYLPELPDFPHNPSVRQLLTHTGGYRCHVADGFLADGGHAVKPPGSAMAALLRQTELNAVPGQRWLYSNGGYHLLSEIIERVGKQRFEDFLRDEIFQPLGMVDTESIPSDFAIVPGLAALTVQYPDGRYQRGMFPHEDLRGEGGIVSTVDDMLRWLAHLRAPAKVGSAATWQQMLAPAVLSDGSTVPYSMGLLHMRFKGMAVIQHAGAVMGGSAQALTIPSHAIDVVVLCNGAPVSPGLLANDVVAALLRQDGRVEQEVGRPRAEDYASLIGQRYHAPSGMLIEFRESEQLLALAVLGNSPVPLQLVGDDLVMAFEDAALGPIVLRGLAAGLARAPDTIDASEGALRESFARLDPRPDQCAQLARDLAGFYLCPDLGSSAEVFIDGEQLRMRVQSRSGGVDMRLDPVTAGVIEWSAADPLMPMVGVINVRRGPQGVTGFDVEAWTSRHLRYVRACAPSSFQDKG